MNHNTKVLTFEMETLVLWSANQIFNEEPIRSQRVLRSANERIEKLWISKIKRSSIFFKSSKVSTVNIENTWLGFWVSNTTNPSFEDEFLNLNCAAEPPITGPNCAGGNHTKSWLKCQVQQTMFKPRFKFFKFGLDERFCK